MSNPFERKLDLAMRRAGVIGEGETELNRIFNKRIGKPAKKKQRPATGYISPDDIFTSKFLPINTFIYAGKSGKLYDDDGTVVHTMMMRENPNIVKGLGLNPADTQWMVFMKEEPEVLRLGLFGRTGEMLKQYSPTGRAEVVVSFWQTPTDIFQQMLKPCLQGLLDRSLIMPDALVHHPSMVGVPVSEVMGGKARASQDDEAMEKARLARELHLMRGSEKKAAMKKLGLGTGSKEPDIQRSLKKANLLVPGQKWWAPHSESVEPTIGRMLERALRGQSGK